MLLLGTTLFAQTSTGTFVGVVTDQTRAVVPGATMTVTNKGTNRTFTVVSHEDGADVVPLLRNV